MQHRDIENLLRRYRPAQPHDQLFDQVTESPNREITRSSWPWALAAAALLAITVGLHGAVAVIPESSSLVDPTRVQAIVEELGGGSESLVMAEWIARREAMAEQERQARMSAAVPGPQ